ncbi:MAG: FecR domain-containing protein [Hyphomicrobiaceae bacterium]
MRVLAAACILALVAFLTTTASRAADPIGSAAKVEDTLIGPSGKLVTGASVFFNDKLSTDATGVGQIVFNDGTKLALGPNAQVTIDKFVYKGDGTFGELAVSMTKGAFRWISGKSKPEAYKLSTGWANLAIRGTAFDVNVDPEGQLTLVLYEGAVTVCLVNGDCREIAGRCQYIATETKLQVDDPSKLKRPKARALKESGKFPFIDNDRLIEPFHIASASCKVRKVQKQRKAERTKRTRSKQAAARSTRSKVAAVATVATSDVAQAGEGRSSRAATPDPSPPSTPDPPAPDLSPTAMPDPVDPSTPTVEGPKVDPGKKHDHKGHYGKGHHGKGHHGKGSHGHKGTGNPGNDSDNGNAGESPSGGDFGNGSTGKGDSNGKSGKGSGSGGAGGHGHGTGHGDG